MANRTPSWCPRLKKWERCCRRTPNIRKPKNTCAARLRSARRPPATKAPNCVSDLSQLARLYVLKSNYTSAQTYYQRVLKIQQATLPSASPELLPTLDALAAMSLEQKQYTEAEPLLRQTLSIREGGFGPMHSEVAKNLDQLGWLYTQQKNYGAAVRCYERSALHLDESLGIGESGARRKYQKLAEVYAALNRPVDAEPLVRQVLSTRENETVASLNTLASIYIARDNLTEAEPLYRLSIAILDKRGILTAKRPVAARSDPGLELLAETATDYVELLKKMKRKSEASKLEARIRVIVGKTYTKKRPG